MSETFCRFAILTFTLAAPAVASALAQQTGQPHGPIMPTAATSPLFADFIDSDREVVSGIITASTLFALVTLPIWYTLIEKWSWL